MKISNYTPQYQPIKKQNPSFGCERCNLIIKGLEEQQIPRQQAILCLDIALNHNMKRLAEMAKQVFIGDETAIQDAVADHKSAVELVFPVFQANCDEIAQSIKQNW